MENIAEHLRLCPALAGMSNAQLVAIVSKGKELSARAGQVLFQEGDPSVSMYFLLRGKVEVKGKQGFISWIPENGLFGEMGVVSRIPRSASVVAKDGATVFALPRDDFFELIETDKEFGYLFCRNLVDVLVEKLKKNNTVLEFTQLLTSSSLVMSADDANAGRTRPRGRC